MQLGYVGESAWLLVMLSPQLLSQTEPRSLLSDMTLEPQTPLGSREICPSVREHPCAIPAQPSQTVVLGCLVVALGGPSHCPVSSLMPALASPSTHTAISLHPPTAPLTSLLLCPPPRPLHPPPLPASPHVPRAGCDAKTSSLARSVLKRIPHPVATPLPPPCHPTRVAPLPPGTPQCRSRTAAPGGALSLPALLAKEALLPLSATQALKIGFPPKRLVLSFFFNPQLVG